MWLIYGWIKKRSRKNLTQNGVPQRYSWETQKKKKKKEDLHHLSHCHLAIQFQFSHVTSVQPFCLSFHWQRLSHSVTWPFTHLLYLAIQISAFTGNTELTLSTGHSNISFLTQHLPRFIIWSKFKYQVSLATHDPFYHLVTSIWLILPSSRSVSASIRDTSLNPSFGHRVSAFPPTPNLLSHLATQSKLLLRRLTHTIIWPISLRFHSQHQLSSD